MIRFGDINPQLASRLVALGGALGHGYDVDIAPDVDAGRLAFLASRQVLTLVPAAQVAAQEKARELVRFYDDAMEAVDLPLSLSTCAQAFLGSLADQLEAGKLGAVSHDTARRKLSLHQPTTYGVATGATIRALRAARPTVRRTG